MFDEIASLADDADQMFQRAAEELVKSGQLHRLFDLRLLQRRHELGLPLGGDASLGELDEALREQLEQGYLAACREVGQLLLESGDARGAWTYLRPASEKGVMRRWLECAVPDDENADELIELALYEAIDPERGFAWLLARRGTCNAITEMGAIAGQLPVAEQRACASVLVRHLHDEVLGNVRGHLQRLGQASPATDSLAALLEQHPELLADAAYHVDTSHLATTVRYARTLTDPALLRLASELAEYGGGLDESLQYPDQPPFEDLYATHRLFFGALLGEEVERAVEYFRGRALEVDAGEHGTGAIETYLILLERTSQAEIALADYLEVVPTECALSPYAPTLLQLAEASGCWERYLEICQERSDVVGYAAGQLAQPPAKTASERR